MSESQPRSLEVKCICHGSAPIPMGAPVGNRIYSSGIMGKDPATDQLPTDVALQANFAFQNMVSLLAAGGATPDHVAKMTIFIKDESAHGAIKKEWRKLYPDSHDLPARHTLTYGLGGSMLLQPEVEAVIT